MPLYIADYRADTAHLSASQHGAYLLLIMHYWSTGSLPNDDAALARIAAMTPVEWKRNRATVAAFFGDNWTHKRIDAELNRAKEISDKRSASAKQRHSKSYANAEQVDTHARVLPQSQSPSEAKASAPTDPEADLFRRGREVLGKSSGGLIKQLLAAKGGKINLARAAIETAAGKNSPREYIGAAIRGPEPPPGQTDHRVDPRL
ncbi:YdaU family protein [Bradyrhizobium sp. SZCCHNRI1073]|uniref:YdaU family protein n=1 Tax=Bradyrhizobium sp. SZCCHNRI1073 TaxID=3057280 RepID=UPI002915E280|nr:DUF1376 domain-containing protein [Bradyrhizobium sp. SZCCHNRI1073]